jgi:nucleoside-diphosphate-sugar epimerase
MMSNSDNRKVVYVTGGAGYVGAVLVPKLLNAGYAVRVLDLFMYGEDVFDGIKGNPYLTKIKGDLRDRKLLEGTIPGSETIIHLACISNDPSYELNPSLGKSINYDAFFDLLDVAVGSGVQRFVYASSSSVYGVKEQENVTEELPLKPLTDYSKYKAECEKVLITRAPEALTYCIVRPATLCGYSPRQRLDLSVNILTNHAINKKFITVFGGAQKRPNLHVQDMADLYVMLCGLPSEKINKKIYNVGFENLTIMNIAKMVQRIVDPLLPITVTQTDDNRSYHISSEKIIRELGFTSKRTIENAVTELVKAFRDGLLIDPLNNIRYYNIKTMQTINLR